MGRERSRRSWFWRCRTIPELLGSDRSPLVLGDWLEVIAPIMKDVSPQAHRWWPLVEEEARHYYETWRQSTPVERLYVKPRCKVVEEDPSLQRTEQRGISLLIKAVPESIKETIVSERMMTSTGNHLHPDEELPAGRSQRKIHAPHDTDPTIMGHIG